MANEIRTDESGATRDEDFHRADSLGNGLCHLDGFVRTSFSDEIVGAQKRLERSRIGPPAVEDFVA